MASTNDSVRDHLVRVLDWEEAHVSFEKAVAGLPAGARGQRPSGFERSVWELVEHLRIAQEDLLDFCVNPTYVHTRTWPDDYWPTSAAPVDEAAWQASLAAYRRSLAGLTEVVRTVDDLTALVPTGKDRQTYLRSILLVADHAAYHVGQIVAVRRALGAW